MMDIFTLLWLFIITYPICNNLHIGGFCTGYYYVHGGNTLQLVHCVFTLCGGYSIQVVPNQYISFSDRREAPDINSFLCSLYLIKNPV